MILCWILRTGLLEHETAQEEIDQARSDTGERCGGRLHLITGGTRGDHSREAGIQRQEESPLLLGHKMDKQEGQSSPRSTEYGIRPEM